MLTKFRIYNAYIHLQLDLLNGEDLYVSIERAKTAALIAWDRDLTNHALNAPTKPISETPITREHQEYGQEQVLIPFRDALRVRCPGLHPSSALG